MTTQITEQSNTYRVLDSMGRMTGIYIMASNIKEACQSAKAKQRAGEIKSSYYKVVRCYSGGVRG